MNRCDRRHPLLSGAKATSLGTLVSRVSGMVRDMATAPLFGLAGGGVMDAFVIAFRIPNLFRRLFGEGALAASYLPVLAGQLECDRRRAWQLASVMFTWLVILLSGLVVLGEGLFALVWLVWGDVPGVGLLMGLSAVMLPYLLLICLAAVWLVAPIFAPNPRAQAYALAVAVLLRVVLPLGLCGATYAIALRLLGGRELGMLLSGRTNP